MTYRREKKEMRDWSNHAVKLALFFAKGEEMEGTKAGSLGVMMRVTRQCKKTHIQNVSSSSSGVKKFKKAKNDDSKNKKELVVYKDNKRKITINRWSAER